jgi:hypothetical protein
MEKPGIRINGPPFNPSSVSNPSLYSNTPTVIGLTIIHQMFVLHLLVLTTQFDQVFGLNHA